MVLACQSFGQCNLIFFKKGAEKGCVMESARVVFIPFDRCGSILWRHLCLELAARVDFLREIRCCALGTVALIGVARSMRQRRIAAGKKVKKLTGLTFVREGIVDVACAGMLHKKLGRGGLLGEGGVEDVQRVAVTNVTLLTLDRRKFVQAEWLSKVREKLSREHAVWHEKVHEIRCQYGSHPYTAPSSFARAIVRDADLAEQEYVDEKRRGEDDDGNDGDDDGDDDDNDDDDDDDAERRGTEEGRAERHKQEGEEESLERVFGKPKSKGGRILAMGVAIAKMRLWRMCARFSSSRARHANHGGLSNHHHHLLLLLLLLILHHH